MCGCWALKSGESGRQWEVLCLFKPIIAASAAEQRLTRYLSGIRYPLRGPLTTSETDKKRFLELSSGMLPIGLFSLSSQYFWWADLCSEIVSRVAQWLRAVCEMFVSIIVVRESSKLHLCMRSVFITATFRQCGVLSFA